MDKRNNSIRRILSKGSISYNATYQWDKGATVEDIYLGNSIQNQASWNADAKINFDKPLDYLLPLLYNTKVVNSEA